MTKIARVYFIHCMNISYEFSCVQDNRIKTKSKSFLGVLFGIITFKYVFLRLVGFYKFCISPILPHSCIFVPSCSTYMIEAIKRYGVINGVLMGSYRILRCNPFNSGGVDTVPDNIKGDMKWLY